MFVRRKKVQRTVARTDEGTTLMNGHGKSDGPVVPKKGGNKESGAPDSADRQEGRGPVKGNSDWQNRQGTQSPSSLQQALDRIRQVAEKDKEVRLTALWHHVYSEQALEEAYYGVKRDAGAGVDGETWKSYGEDLEGRLRDLSGRLRRGSYRARPVRRSYVQKRDGRQRPIGVPSLEDKIVQRATVQVLNAVYETMFKGYSYGFRPGRSAHNALDALTVGLERKKVNWVLDADIRGFFDTIDHECLVEFIERRIADRRVIRHVKKWLKAGVMEKGQWRESEMGTPQGGSISPLLANIYLHYVLDTWTTVWRKESATGEVIIVRYADDFVVGFQHKRDAERYLEQLRRRLEEFGLQLHPEKTRLIEFGRFASQNRASRGQGKPETFEFLGFTHCCGQTRKGKFCVLRRVSRNRMTAKLHEINERLHRWMHLGVQAVGEWLRAVIIGYYRYFAVPRNLPMLRKFRRILLGLWYQVLRRRSQKSRLKWKQHCRINGQWLPEPKVLHPYPDQRLRV